MTLRVGCATVGSASSRGRFGPWPKERLADGGARGVARTHSCDEHGLTSRLLRVEGDKPTRVQPRNRFAERQRWLELAGRASGAHSVPTHKKRVYGFWDISGGEAVGTTARRVYFFTVF